MRAGAVILVPAPGRITPAGAYRLAFVSWVLVACVVWSLPTDAQRARRAATGPIPYPHPLIVEVLFDPPGGAAGDATGDGQRQPVGDEFVEIINPHDRPISVGGYTLSDRNYPGYAGFRFQFPAMRLRPGETAVVFNGFESTIQGPFGNSERRSGKSRAFDGAYVFHAAVESDSVALANSGDWVLLATPRGRPVHCVWWGEFEAPLPEAPGLLLERAPAEASGSVVRRTDAPDGEHWVEHPEIDDGLRFSPGRVVEPAPDAPADGDPAGDEPGGNQPDSGDDAKTEEDG